MPNYIASVDQGDGHLRYRSPARSRTYAECLPELTLREQEILDAQVREQMSNSAITGFRSIEFRTIAAQIIRIQINTPNPQTLPTHTTCPLCNAIIDLTACSCGHCHPCRDNPDTREAYYAALELTRASQLETVTAERARRQSLREIEQRAARRQQRLTRFSVIAKPSPVIAPKRLSVSGNKSVVQAFQRDNTQTSIAQQIRELRDQQDFCEESYRDEDGAVVGPCDDSCCNICARNIINEERIEHLQSLQRQPSVNDMLNQAIFGSAYRPPANAEALIAFSARPTILSNDYRLSSWDFYKQPWENTLYMGLELEMAFQRNPFDIFAKITKEYLLNKHIWKRDGSILTERYGDGAELVVTPATLQYHTKKIDWRKCLEALKSAGAASYTPNTCGLHIHVNKDLAGVQPGDVDKLKAFFCNSRAWIIKFSRRQSAQLNQWAKIPSTWDSEDWSHDRYMSLNNTTKTLEFRIFRGTLGYKTFKATLQFVDGLITFAKTHSFQAMNNVKFTDWLRSQGQYRHLLDYLLRGDKEED